MHMLTPTSQEPSTPIYKVAILSSGIEALQVACRLPEDVLQVGHLVYTAPPPSLHSIVFNVIIVALGFALIPPL
jgi:hypothetical protein